MIVCAICIVVHTVIQLIIHYRMKKVVKEYCEKCGQPVYEDDVHKCLDEQQLDKLVEFVKSVKESVDGRS